MYKPCDAVTWQVFEYSVNAYTHNDLHRVREKYTEAVRVFMEKYIYN